MQARGEMDLIDQFAFPLPVRVIAEILGIPADDFTQFQAWSKLFIESAAGDAEAIAQAIEQTQAFYLYLKALVATKRQMPADDLLSQLIQVEAQGEKLSEEELIATTFLLIVAGHETTVHLIGNGMLALLQHPQQLTLLQENPTLMKTAIEEFLRYRGPLLTATERWAREDLVFQGQQIHRGDYIIIALAAANRDEASFADPDTLDITREENRHLAFGKGIHYCLGAPLARLEGEIAIGTLLRRLPHVHLETPPEQLVWRPGTLILGLAHLPVAF